MNDTPHGLILELSDEITSCPTDDDPPIALLHYLIRCWRARQCCGAKQLPAAASPGSAQADGQPEATGNRGLCRETRSVDGGLI